MLADITGRTIETVDGAQEVGAGVAALTVAAGVLGTDVLEFARQLVKAKSTYVPNADNKVAYDLNYKVFKRLYKTNAESFKKLNG